MLVFQTDPFHSIAQRAPDELGIAPDLDGADKAGSIVARQAYEARNVLISDALYGVSKLTLHRQSPKRFGSVIFGSERFAARTDLYSENILIIFALIFRKVKT